MCYGSFSLSVSGQNTLLKIDSTLFSESHFSNITKPEGLQLSFTIIIIIIFHFQNQKVDVYIYTRIFSRCEEGFPVHRFKDVRARKDHYDNSACPLQCTCYRTSLGGWLKADLLEDISSCFKHPSNFGSLSFTAALLNCLHV